MSKFLFLLFLIISSGLCFCQSEESIHKLKTGAILIKLPSKINSINNLSAHGKNELANVIEKRQYDENKEIVETIEASFNYCPTYYFYSQHIDSVYAKHYNGILMNEKLEIDSTINVDSIYCWIIEFGVRKDSYDKYYKAHKNVPAEYYSNPAIMDTDVVFYYLIVRDSENELLLKSNMHKQELNRNYIKRKFTAWNKKFAQLFPN